MGVAPVVADPFVPVIGNAAGAVDGAEFAPRNQMGSFIPLRQNQPLFLLLDFVLALGEKRRQSDSVYLLLRPLEIVKRPGRLAANDDVLDDAAHGPRFGLKTSHRWYRIGQHPVDQHARAPFPDA